MKRIRSEKKAGHLLAEGVDYREIAARLNLQEEKLLAWTKDEQLREAYQQSVKIREMQSYGIALDWLNHQMRSDNAATALKAVHEVLSHLGREEETAAAGLRLTEESEGEA